jgi:hypothetical protein
VDGKDVTVAVVGPNGHPVYEIEGKEVEQDIVALRSDLAKLNSEDAGWRHKYRQLETQFEPFKELDPEKAKHALDVVASLDDKKLLDAKQVDVMKAQWEESFKQNKAASDAGFQAKIDELAQALDSERGNIKKMLVQRVFTDSKFLEGTTFDKLRDGAYLMFGDRFVVEQGDNGDYRVVAKNPDGTPILSIARPGQIATTDEAIEHIISAHPQKDYILKGSQASGSGAQGSAGGGSKGTLQNLQAAYDIAVKNGDAMAIVSLKRQLFEAQQRGAT